MTAEERARKCAEEAQDAYHAWKSPPGGRWQQVQAIIQRHLEEHAATGLHYWNKLQEERALADRLGEALQQACRCSHCFATGNAQTITEALAAHAEARK